MRLTQLLRLAAGPSGNKNDAKSTPPKSPSQDWRWKVSGLTIKDMKKHYAIVPMYGFTLFAICLAGAYVIRLATKHPEVAWTKSNSEPWNDYKNKQYKFLDSGRDYSRGSPAPTFK